MGFDMSPVGLKKLCREKRLFASLPELNEVLHLHHRGIVEIKGLEEYTGLKTLHLESNAILKIKGLDCLMNLRCLYLNQNLLEDVEGLDKLPRLEALDLADNQIKCLKGLSCCQCLRQLNLSGNMLCLEEDVAHLTKCKSLQSLDISRNKLDNEESLQIIQSLRLTLLKMSGNPIVSTIPYYRKLCLVQMPTLTYLDESPVSENERRLARAWTEGGNEEETSMRETIRKEEAHQREIHRQGTATVLEGWMVL
ncbi:leucine-rich repeat-containing protein ODA7 [Selaginella moellendorffii]|uniref:leucine-rich repeat-containing protein ODA7 n=1 Tax=Selaginella moellendorffii TaxID=88036 RepID=UPI000D1CD4E4|nr:leucine-rich repeat-containing protein ODA7 [Selaginella moellendorffii]|eukprot:XP_024518978.1 leucine-rich repeat-containing protein ODA7 [Selaginella moellendorffii]